MDGTTGNMSPENCRLGSCKGKQETEEQTQRETWATRERERDIAEDDDDNEPRGVTVRTEKKHEVENHSVHRAARSVCVCVRRVTQDRSTNIDE